MYRAFSATGANYYSPAEAWVVGEGGFQALKTRAKFDCEML